MNTIIYHGGHSIDDYFQDSGIGGRSGEKACLMETTDCPLREEPSSTRDHEIAAVPPKQYSMLSTVAAEFFLIQAL